MSYSIRAASRRRKLKLDNNNNSNKKLSGDHDQNETEQENLLRLESAMQVPSGEFLDATSASRTREEERAASGHHQFNRMYNTKHQAAKNSSSLRQASAANLASNLAAADDDRGSLNQMHDDSGNRQQQQQQRTSSSCSLLARRMQSKLAAGKSNNLLVFICLLLLFLVTCQQQQRAGGGQVHAQQYRPDWPNKLIQQEIFLLNLEDGYFGCQVNESQDFLQLFELSRLCDGQPQCYRGTDEIVSQLKCNQRDQCGGFGGLTSLVGAGGGGSGSHQLARQQQQQQEPIQCVNGVCLDGLCYCNDGWGGKSCDVPDENECKYRPCDVFAHCTNTMGSYYCSCFPGEYSSASSSSSLACSSPAFSTNLSRRLS